MRYVFFIIYLPPCFPVLQFVVLHPVTKIYHDHVFSHLFIKFIFCKTRLSRNQHNELYLSISILYLLLAIPIRECLFVP